MSEITSPTFGQALQILNLVHSKKKSLDEIEKLIESGMLSDIVDSDFSQIDRNDFREYLGLPRSGFGLNMSYTTSLEVLLRSRKLKYVDERITSTSVPFDAKLHPEPRKIINLEIHTFVRKGVIVGVDNPEGLDGQEFCMKKLGERKVRGATLKELIMFNELYSDESKGRKIFAPGSCTTIDSGTTWHQDNVSGVYKCMVYLENGGLYLADESAWQNYYQLAVSI